MESEIKKSKGKSVKKWMKKCVILVLAVCMLQSPFMSNLGTAGSSVGTIEAQAAEVYKRFYFQGGLIMIPGSCISYTWTKMEKGDRVQFAVNGNGTLKVGICRMSDNKRIGVERTGNFSTTIIVPSTGYYKVFIMNTSSRTVSFKGVAVCSR